MRIGIEFDGNFSVNTNIHDPKSLSYCRSSPVSLPIDRLAIRKGIYELISVLGLFGDIYVLTSRSNGFKMQIEEWLIQNGMYTLIEEIVFCENSSIAEIAHKNKLNLIILNNAFTILTSCIQNQNLTTIIWYKQSWLELLIGVFGVFIKSKSTYLKANPNAIIYKAEYFSELGSSPIFLLFFSDNTKLKLRICFDINTKNRIMNFLEITSANKYEHVSRLVCYNGLAIVKSYTVGLRLDCIDNTRRLEFINKTGIALARLHAINIINYKDSVSENIKSKLLVCSADNYNIIINTSKEITFIDLEAVTIGPRWVDMIWAQNLLCNNSQELVALTNGYFSICEELRLNSTELSVAKGFYRNWLTTQLTKSLTVHEKDIIKKKEIILTLFNLWSNIWRNI